MTALSPTMRKGLGIPEDKEIQPEMHLLFDLKIRLKTIISYFMQKYPLVIGMDNSNANNKSAFLIDVLSMDAQESSDGEPLTVQRFAVLDQKCIDNEYPDNGSD